MVNSIFQVAFVFNHPPIILICDEYNHRVQVWSANDDKIQPIYSIGRTGQPSDAKGEFNYPYGVCCSPDGSFSVADYSNHRVQRYDASGRFPTTFGSRGQKADQFYPFDVCHLHHHFAPSSSASSLLLVTDYLNKRLSIWSADGHQHITNLPTNGAPCGICVDLNGFVNVSCGYWQSPHIVCIYDPRKNYELLQTLGDEQGSAPGQFYFPIGLCVDDLNILMVVDRGNYRVQFFD